MWRSSSVSVYTTPWAPMGRLHIVHLRDGWVVGVEVVVSPIHMSVDKKNSRFVQKVVRRVSPIHVLQCETAVANSLCEKQSPTHWHE